MIHAHKKLTPLFTALAAILLIFSVTGCSSTASGQTGIKVVASTTLVGDVVRQIGGDFISLTVLLPVGADPHTFEPRPQDVAAISDAQIIFLNGLELEHSLEPIIKSNAGGKIVEVSDGVEVIPYSGELAAAAGTSAVDTHAAGDPHTWMDPNAVMIWVDNISRALIELDPDHKADYEANAQAYLQQLRDLDAWIKEQVNTIPAENRILVTDHENMGYFVKRYGFTLAGLVVDSLSTGASPSAQELSQLEDTIRQQGVKAVFVGSTVNPALSEQVARDTGVKLVVINTESLGDANSDISSYILFIKKMVTQIVEGLQ